MSNTKEKNIGLALILNLFIPGLGLFYLKKLGWFLFFMAADLGILGILHSLIRHKKYLLVILIWLLWQVIVSSITFNKHKAIADTPLQKNLKFSRNILILSTFINFVLCLYFSVSVFFGGGLYFQDLPGVVKGDACYEKVYNAISYANADKFYIFIILTILFFVSLSACAKMSQTYLLEKKRQEEENDKLTSQTV